jgi:hypothetical protein
MTVTSRQVWEPKQMIWSLWTGMRSPNKFENLNKRLASLETEITQERVCEPKRSIYEFRDQDDTAKQVKDHWGTFLLQIFNLSSRSKDDTLYGTKENS